MAAEEFVRPWHGRVFRHIPGDSTFPPLDTRFAARSHEHHWNRPTEPTLYFATDRTMLESEFVRHLDDERASETKSLVRTRRIFEIDLVLSRVYDLTDPTATAELGITNSPECFHDRQIARATAGFLRDVIEVEAILAPSPRHRSTEMRLLVVFTDRLDRPLEQLAERITASGSFHPVS